MRKPDPKVSATPRPVRIAYLLQDGPDAHAWLDAVFADCFSRDGGRQSLVVPVSATGVIPDGYLNWLQFIDPDYVVLMTYDNSAMAGILTPLMPETMFDGRNRKPDVVEDHPRVGLEPHALTSISWLPFLKIVSGWHRPAPQFILDAYPAWKDDGFITDNFGTPQGCHLGFPSTNWLGISSLLLTPADAPPDRWHMKVDEALEVNDAYQAVQTMARKNDVVSMSMLSNLAPLTGVPDHPWASGFCLVVGDSLTDRLSCWNAGLLCENGQNQPYKTMRVPASVVENESQIVCIAEFLRYRNWIGANNTPPRIVVRSHSMEKETLTDFLEKLQSLTHAYVEFKEIEANNDCCPTDLGNARVGTRFGEMANDRSETAVREPTTTLISPAPKHLGYCAGQHPMFSRGNWQVDLRIDRLNDIGRFINVREPWMLPARRQIVNSFCQRRDSRVNRNGNLSVTADIETLQIDVANPADDQFFSLLLAHGPQVSTYDLRQPYLPQNCYRYCDVSDKGRYLDGVLGLFGDLHNAASTLGNHFWRTQFIALSAPAEAQQQEVVDDMKRRLRASNGIAVIDSEAAWNGLAKRVIQKASRLRVPRSVTCHSRLLTAWKNELSAALDADDNLRARRDEILGEASGDLRRALHRLLRQGIFYRGHEWVCPRCSHRNWTSIEDMKNEVACVVCDKQHLIPVDLEFDLRLNEFLSSCIREHDTLTVIASLSALQNSSQTSFFFHPQTNLYRDYPEKQHNRIDREIDLVCLIDSRFAVGEAKANVNLIQTADIDDMAATAKELNADVVVLSALAGDKGLLASKGEQLRQRVGGSVDVRTVLSDWEETPTCII